MTPSDEHVAAVSRQLATLLASRVHHLRAVRGWSLRTLYERSGVSTSTVTGIGRGGLPDMQTIVRLALAFEVTSLEEMFGAHMPTSTAFEAAGLSPPEDDGAS